MKMYKPLLNCINAILILFIVSCNNNGLNGSKYYLLTGGTTGYGTNLKEMELNFISNDKVEARMLLYADDFGYKTINDTSRESESKIYAYKYESGVFELPDFKLLTKLEFLNDGRIKTNEGEYWYTSSIVPLLGKQEADTRIEESCKSKALVQIYKQMLRKPNRPLIRIENGKIISNTGDPEVTTSKWDSLQKEYNLLAAKIAKEFGVNTQFHGSLGESYEELKILQKRLQTKIQDGSKEIYSTSNLLQQVKNKLAEMLSEIQKLKDENTNLH